MHLTVGTEVGTFIDQDSKRVIELPFTLCLDSFRVEYYPGTDAPADYVSYIRDAEPVSMNRILSRQGYRFYQSSFDDDKEGSWLSVNYDPWGIGITYAGYILLGISMLWMLIGRSGEFRRLLRHPLLRKGECLCGCSWLRERRCKLKTEVFRHLHSDRRIAWHPNK